MTQPRGTCWNCHYRWRLTKKGVLVRHSLYGNGGRYVCTGSGFAPAEEWRKE